MISNDLLQESMIGQILVLKLNRPERRNALSFPLINRLSDALSAACSNPTIRAMIITGEGRAFCSGMDLREKEPGIEESNSSTVVLTAFSDLISQIHRSRKPVIAAMNGDAMAGGAGLTVACDFAIAAEQARVGFPEVRLGLVAAIVMHDLVISVGDRNARELLLTGTPVSAERALQIGLVNRVVPANSCLSESIELANALCEGGPRAVSTTKELLEEAVGRSSELRGAAAISALIRESDEGREGIAAFLERRPPVWSGTQPRSS